MRQIESVDAATPQCPQRQDIVAKISIRRRDRALEIQEMYDQGWKTSDIAKRYGISERMVRNDLQLATRLSREKVEKIDQAETLGRKIYFLETLCRYAMQQCQDCQNDNAKVGWARLAKDTQETLIKLYQSVGLITTVPTRVSIDDANPFADADYRREYVAILLRARERGVPIAGL